MQGLGAYRISMGQLLHTAQALGRYSPFRESQQGTAAMLAETGRDTHRRHRDSWDPMQGTGQRRHSHPCRDIWWDSA